MVAGGRWSSVAERWQLKPEALTNLVGCVETKQIRATWIAQAVTLNACLEICTYFYAFITWCSQSWMWQLVTELYSKLPPPCSYITMYFKIHSWHYMVYSNKYSTRQRHELKDPHSLVISWNITWSHVHVRWHVTHHVCTVEQWSGRRLMSWDSTPWINDI